MFNVGQWMWVRLTASETAILFPLWRVGGGARRVGPRLCRTHLKPVHQLKPAIPPISPAAVAEATFPSSTGFIGLDTLGYPMCSPAPPEITGHGAAVLPLHASTAEQLLIAVYRARCLHRSRRLAFSTIVSRAGPAGQSISDGAILDDSFPPPSPTGRNGSSETGAPKGQHVRTQEQRLPQAVAAGLART